MAERLSRAQTSVIKVASTFMGMSYELDFASYRTCQTLLEAQGLRVMNPTRSLPNNGECRNLTQIVFSFNQATREVDSRRWQTPLVVANDLDRLLHSQCISREFREQTYGLSVSLHSHLALKLTNQFPNKNIFTNLPLDRVIDRATCLERTYGTMAVALYRAVIMGVLLESDAYSGFYNEFDPQPLIQAIESYVRD